MAEHHVRINLFSSALAIGLCVVASVVASVFFATRTVRQTVQEVKRQEQAIAVRGSARQHITSDLAVWRVRVRAEGTELLASYEEIERSKGRLMEFLKAGGFKPEQVSESPISTESHFARDERGRPTRQVASYELGQIITVTSPDCARVAAAAGKATDLIKQGVQVVSWPAEFTYTKLADLRVSILGDAAKDARTRADEIAQNSGCEIGELRSAQTGILQVVQPNSTDVSGGGQYDTSTIEKDVTVVVNLTFAVRARP